MNDYAISVEGLTKRYRIGKQVESDGGRLPGLEALTAPFRYLASTLREPTPEETIWALKDVSFEVKTGEVLGIVGHNGAGKSTLLKLLARITEPTRGRAVIRGRVGSLLEVGTGFHPELTGRENIYLYGAILGMKKAEIDRKFDEIVAFAETGKFVDTQVKRYSSGMYVRLAFAVAAHLEPEILLVDEVLAVGDAAFQKKCLGKMENVAEEGRTVLFVSHNMVAIQSLCNRVIWMSNGSIMEQGLTKPIVSRYLQRYSATISEQTWEDKATAPGNDQVRLRSVRICPEDGTPANRISMETPLALEVEYWNLVPDARLHVTLHFYTEQQIVAFTAGSCLTAEGLKSDALPAGLFRSVCHLPARLLNSGMHRVLLLVVKNMDTIIFRYDNALSFDVLDLLARQGAWYGKEPGVVQPWLEWTTECLGDTPA